MFNVWFGRFLPPSDRANLYGPFYANEWAVYNDGIQDGYPFVYQGRDNGVAYWGDFKAGTAKIKALGGRVRRRFRGPGVPSVIWAGRVQFDFWDPENGYYLNGTYYGDKNLLAIGGATQVQADKTATTVDFLMERKVMNGGAFTIESEYSRYNRLGGYNANYGKSEGGVRARILSLSERDRHRQDSRSSASSPMRSLPMGLDRQAANPSYRQKTTEVDVSYIMKQFDARVYALRQEHDLQRVYRRITGRRASACSSSSPRQITKEGP